MKALYDLKEMLSAELEEIARKPEMSAGDLETVHKLTDTIKNIDKICALEEDGGYSEAGDTEMGGYGRHDAKEAMMEQARGMMDSATSEREREAIRRFMAELERD